MLLLRARYAMPHSLSLQFKSRRFLLRKVPCDFIPYLILSLSREESTTFPDFMEAEVKGNFLVDLVRARRMMLFARTNAITFTSHMTRLNTSD